jgi:hypothetical protein
MRDTEPEPDPIPVPVIQLDYADPAPGRRRQTLLRWTRYAATLALLTAAAAWALLCFVRVESVVLTGPILFVLGALTLVGGFLTGRTLLIGIGGAHCFICVLFVALVNALRWNPREAHDPFTWMGLVFTAAVTVPTLVAWAGDRTDYYSSPLVK